MESVESYNLFFYCYRGIRMATTGNKIRAIRKARLLQQQTLADSAALSVQALRAIEAGRTATPPARNHRAACRSALCASSRPRKPEPERTSLPEKGGADRINLRSSTRAGAVS